MPAVKDMQWLEFFAVVGCPMVWGCMIGIWCITEMNNTGLVDGFAMALSWRTVSAVTLIVSRWATEIAGRWSAAASAGSTLDLWPYAGMLALYVFHASLVVLLLNCQRRVKLVYFARKSGGTLHKEDEAALTTYVPIKAVTSGVMPIFMAETAVTLLQQASLASAKLFHVYPFYLTPALRELLVIFFIILACVVDLNNVPSELAETLTKFGTRVPGVRPGSETVAYLKKTQGATRLLGGMAFGGLAFLSMQLTKWAAHHGLAASSFTFTDNILLVRRSSRAGGQRRFSRLASQMAALLHGKQNVEALLNKPKTRRSRKSL